MLRVDIDRVDLYNIVNTAIERVRERYRENKFLKIPSQHPSACIAYNELVPL